MNQYLESTLFQSNTETHNRIYTSVSSATTKTALESSVDETKTVYKAILGSGSL